MGWCKASAQLLVEDAVVVITSGLLCHSLLLRQAAEACALSLACITLLCVARDVSGGDEAAAERGCSYELRDGASGGRTLGAVALPWACAGVAAVLREGCGAGWVLQALHATLLSSWAATAFVEARSCGELRRSRSSSSTAAAAGGGAGGARGAGRRAAGAGAVGGSMLWALAAATGAASHAAWLAVSTATTAVTTSPVQQQKQQQQLLLPPNAVAVALVTAAASMGALHAALSRLPRTFTLGEGLAAAQGLALMAGQAAVLGAWRPTASPDGNGGGGGGEGRSWWGSSVGGSQGGGAGIAALSALVRSALPGHIQGGAAGGADGHAGSCAGVAGAVAPIQLSVCRLVPCLVVGSVAAAAVLVPLLRASFPATAPRPPSMAAAAAKATKDGGSRGNGPAPSTAARLALPAVLAALAAAVVDPAAAVLAYALGTRARLAVLGGWALQMAVALPLMLAASRAPWLPNILLRKGYHFLAIALFLPPLLPEPALLAAALAVAFALLVALEVARVGGVPLVGPAVHRFMTSFTDARDAGAILVTHFTLLLGFAAPVWAHACAAEACAQSRSLAGASAADDGSAAASTSALLLLGPALAGVMMLGVCDTAACVVGRCAGRRRIFRGQRKTWEGTAGATLATLLAWAALARWWWPYPADSSGSSTGDAGGGVSYAAGTAPTIIITGSGSGGGSAPGWAALAGATGLAALLEAATTQLDNVFLPVHYFSLLCLLVARQQRVVDTF